MHKFNIAWGAICLTFSIGASLFIAAAGKPAIFFVLALLPFVIGANSLHIGLKEKKELEASGSEE